MKALCLLFVLGASLALGASGSGTITGAGAVVNWTAVPDGDGGMEVVFSGSVVGQADGPGAKTFVLSYSADPQQSQLAILVYTPAAGSTTNFSGQTAYFSTLSETVYFWRETTSGFEQQGSASIEGPAGSWKAKLRLHNRTNDTVPVQLYQGETLVGSVNALPNVTTVFNYEGVHPGEVQLRRMVAGVGFTGNSFVQGGSELVGILGSAQPQYLAAGAPVPEFEFVVSGPRPALGDGLKSIWVMDDATLTGNLFREGIDKVAGAIYELGITGGSGGGAGSSQVAISNPESIVDPLVTAMQVNKLGFGTTGQDAVDAVGTIQQLSDVKATDTLTAFSALSPTAPGQITAPTAASDALSFGSIAILGTTFNFAPFQHFPWLRTAMHVMRELLLVVCVLSFVYFAREKLERYLLALYATPQATTKAETVQVAVPGAGWGKQILVASGWVAALVAAVGAFVFAFNSSLAALVPGLSVLAVPQLLSDTVAGMIGNESLALAVSLMGECFPFVAFVQLHVSYLVFGLALPSIWGIALTYAKVVHP